MIGFIFNHDMRDDPYNQNAVNKGFNALEKIVCDMGEKSYYSFGLRRDDFFQGNTDECVLVYYSCDLSVEQKQQIAEKINEILTLKKSACKQEAPNKLVLFEKKAKEDFFVFDA